MDNLENMCDKVCNLAVDTGNFVKSQVNKINRSQIEKKGIHDYVTYVDKNSEKKLTASLQKIFPGAGFIVEEKTIIKKNERFNWIIDPLDGTTNFLHRLPVYSISIALAEHNEIILGVVYEVNSDECFYSWKGGPALLNGEPIRVSDESTLDESLLATGFPYSDFKFLDQYTDLLKDLIRHTRGIRRMGSAAVDLAYVACGRFEGFYEYGLHPWDVAAGSYLVNQAGGKVSDFGGGIDYLTGEKIIASNRGIYENLLEIISKYFG